MFSAFSEIFIEIVDKQNQFNQCLIKNDQMYQKRYKMDNP